ncbi:MAG: hypothetical protein LBT09_01245 [Planctomycetaceae bacterium]|nr:hypothetical protein [Planctomycetaceae bacterium]
MVNGVKLFTHDKRQNKICPQKISQLQQNNTRNSTQFQVNFPYRKPALNNLRQPDRGRPARINSLKKNAEIGSRDDCDPIFTRGF